MICRFARVAAALAIVLSISACDSPDERVAEHQARGLGLLEEGAPEKAALEFRNALEIKESFVPARFELAKILLAQGNVQGAVGNFLKVVELDPAHAGARVQLAQIMLLSDQPEEALKHAEVAFKVAPDDPETLIARALAHYRLGNRDQALADANRVLEVSPNNPTAGLLLVTNQRDSGDLDSALELADRFIAANPGDLPLNFFKAQLLEQDGDDDAFGAQLAHLVSLYPDRVEFRQLLASWHQRAGQMGKVERQLREIQNLQPDDITAVQNLVRFLIRTRGQDTARAELVSQIAAAGAREAPVFPLQSLLADFDFQLGRKEEAETLLREVIATDPDPDTLNKARLQLARIHLSDRNLDSAKSLADDVLASDAKNAEALAIRAAILAERGQTDTAVIDLRGALNENPNSVPLLRLAADIYQRSGRPELAGESLASAVRLSSADPDIVLAYVAFLTATGQTGSIQSVLADAVQRRPGSPQLLAALGAVHVENRNWTAAAQVADELRPLDVEAAERIRAAILAGQGQADEAVAILKRMGETPGAGSVAATIVQIYLQTGQRSLAQAFVDELLQRDGKNSEALRLKGALLQLDGQPDKAAELYQAAISAEPTSPAAYFSLANLHRSQGRPDEAEAVVEKGLAAVPGNPVLILYRADLLQAKGDYSGALEAFEAEYTRRPDSIVAINNLASVLSEHFAKDPEKLARAAEVARRLVGIQSPQIQDTYGWILYLQGKPAEALRSLIPAAEGLPENAWVRYHIGMAYAALDRPEEARGHLEAALELAEGQVFPPEERVRAELKRLRAMQ